MMELPPPAGVVKVTLVEEVEVFLVGRRGRGPRWNLDAHHLASEGRDSTGELLSSVIVVVLEGWRRVNMLEGRKLFILWVCFFCVLFYNVWF